MIDTLLVCWASSFCKIEAKQSTLLAPTGELLTVIIARHLVSIS